MGAPGDPDAETQEFVTNAMVTPSIRLVRELGRGGMGSVWIAEHLRLKTQVVVKFMARETLMSSDALERFEREAALAAQAKSPHVVQVFDHGVSQGGLPYIAMELLEGEDLASRLARQGRIPLSQFADWLTQTCRGLSRAHGKGIVHRDIKPENIFLCDNEGDVLVKVLDFGIAKADASSGFASTRTGAVMGTAYYMSPEQMMGLKTVDLRTDLWALGVVTYLALTGVRVFDGDAIGALVVAITSGPIPPPSSHDPSLTPQVDAWMAKALARDPAQRFSSAKEMAEAFAMVAASAPGHRAATAETLIAPRDSFTSEAQSRAPSAFPTGPSGAPVEALGLNATTMSPSVRSGFAPTSAGAKPTPRWLYVAAPFVVACVLAAGVALVASVKSSFTPSDVASATPGSLGSTSVTLPDVGTAGSAPSSLAASLAVAQPDPPGVAPQIAPEPHDGVTPVAARAAANPGVATGNGKPSTLPSPNAPSANTKSSSAKKGPSAGAPETVTSVAPAPNHPPGKASANSNVAKPAESPPNRFNMPIQ